MLGSGVIAEVEGCTGLKTGRGDGLAVTRSPLAASLVRPTSSGGASRCGATPPGCLATERVRDGSVAAVSVCAAQGIENPIAARPAQSATIRIGHQLPAP